MFATVANAGAPDVEGPDVSSAEPAFLPVAAGTVVGSIAGAVAGLAVAVAVPEIREAQQIAPLSLTMAASSIVGSALGAGVGSAVGGHDTMATTAAVLGALPGGFVGAWVGIGAAYVAMTALPAVATAPSVDGQIHPAVVIVQSLQWLGTTAGAVGGAALGLSVADKLRAHE
jgi:hypothetical protein